MKVAVSLSIGVKPLKPQVDKILSVLRDENIEGFVILAGHTRLDKIGSMEAENLAEQMKERVFLSLASLGSWSAGYLGGMQKACDLGADVVISMDADGSHNPDDLPRFIKLLNDFPAVLSSRFMPEAQNKYPLQRKVISFVGTILTRLLLTKHYLSDFTSGFEGVRTSVIKDMFAKYPISTWICVRVGPYHLQNTELRLALIDMGCAIKEIPIVYGGGNKGKTFDIKFLLKVFRGFIALVINRPRMRYYLGNKDKEHI